MELSLDALYAEHLSHLSRAAGEALAAAGYDAMVLHSGTAKKRSAFDDQYFPLRPEPHFQHWLPLAEPGCALTVAAGRRPVLVWPEAHDFWELPPPPETLAFTEHFEVRRSGATAHVPPGLRVAFVGEDLRAAAALGLEDHANPRALIDRLDRLRVHKTGYEVACLAEANRRAALGHRALERAFRDGASTELDLHLAYLLATGQDDQETPYKNIVALGAHAATLHHVSYGKSAADTESLLVDAGAVVRGYASDITRTWVRGHSEGSDRFEALVAGVETLQLALCEAAVVGRPYESLHDEAHQRVSALLAEIGLVRLSADEIDASGISRAFLPHGLGHSLGLQTHDVGCATIAPRADNPFLRNTTTIEERQVFTIEPGVYFIDALLKPLRTGPHADAIDWALVALLAPLGGVRIEDDLVVKGGVAENLTRPELPRGGGR